MCEIRTYFIIILDQAIFEKPWVANAIDFITINNLDQNMHLSGVCLLFSYSL